MTTEYTKKSLTIHATSPNGFQVAFALELDGSLIAAAEELTAELLRRGYTPAQPAQPAAPAAAADAVPSCPTHQRPMKPMSKADRQGRTHWCTCKVGDGFCQERA